MFVQYWNTVLTYGHLILYDRGGQPAGRGPRDLLNLCKVAPKTRFFLLTVPFSYDIDKASIDTLISKWHLLYHRLENGPILKDKFKDIKSANCYASLKHDFACHKHDYYFIL